MQSIILEKKRIVKDKDGNIFIDLTSRSLRYNNDADVINAFYIGKDMKMRADLISQAAYGNTDNYDLILKYNGISNPFSIDEGDLILIPSLDFMYDSLENPEQIDESEEVRNQYLATSKQSKLDPKKIAYDKSIKQLRKATKGGNFSAYNLPPNLAEPGDSEGRVLNNNSIILGQNVTKNKK